MKTINLSASVDREFVNRVKELSGEDPSRCYQCGNCTAGCPLSEHFDIPVSQVMRLLQSGQKDTVLESKSIWLCATCETCTTRCPCDVDVAHIMDTLRNIAYAEGKQTQKDVRIFYDAFLASVRKHGRVYEIGLLMSYNLKSGHVMTDSDLGPKVLSKGLIHFLPRPIEGKAEIERIFRKFTEKRS